MSQVNASYQYSIGVGVSVGVDIENNHTDESIEYYQNKKNNIIGWSRKFINFFTKTLFFRNSTDSINSTNKEDYYP